MADEIEKCPKCGQPIFQAGELSMMRDVCIGRGWCCPRMSCCSDEACQNYRYYRVYMMAGRRVHRKQKTINIDPASLKGKR